MPVKTTKVAWSNSATLKWHLANSLRLAQHLMWTRVWYRFLAANLDILCSGRGIYYKAPFTMFWDFSCSEVSFGWWIRFNIQQIWFDLIWFFFLQFKRWPVFLKRSRAALHDCRSNMIELNAAAASSGTRELISAEFFPAEPRHHSSHVTADMSLAIAY